MIRIHYFLLAAYFVIVSVAASSVPTRPNILMIIADDYRPEGRLGLDEHPAGSRFTLTNVAQLARQSVVFDAAFAASPSCGPSRSSFLTGFSIDKLRYWSFVSKHWRESGTATYSLPQYYRSIGYKTIAIGKIFHWDQKEKDDARSSWDIARFTGANAAGEHKCDAVGAFFCYCQQGGCADANLASEAISQLNKLASQNQPWFMGLGFRRPHLDWSMPIGWMDSKNLTQADVSFPVNRKMHVSAPSEAYYACNPIIQIAHENLLPQDVTLSDDLTIKIRRYYWSSAVYMDEQLGRVLAHLDNLRDVRDKTIVVFLSDHGWSLGERNLWCKQTLFDDANRVAMMFRVPWMSGNIRRVSRPVSLLDLFPTLIDLSGVPLPEVAHCFNGKSVFSSDEDIGVISQFPRCAAPIGDNIYSNPCMNEVPINFLIMGYSIRTNSYRYTEWRKWGGPNALADWSAQGLVSTELYDHRGNDMGRFATSTYEVLNVANNPAYSSIKQSLANQLRARVLDPNWNGLCKPTLAPTRNPTTKSPTTSSPTKLPTVKPTPKPTIQIPTAAPTLAPTRAPTTGPPTIKTSSPTAKPTIAPTSPPTRMGYIPMPLHPADLQKFQDLYDATNGPQWASCTTSRADPCNIQTNGCDLTKRFIVCEVLNNKLRLVELSLPSNRMKGVIPKSLFTTPTLRLIDFSNSEDNKDKRNVFSYSGNCLPKSARCVNALIDCNFRNTGIQLCGRQAGFYDACTQLKTKSACQENGNGCTYFEGGYGCRENGFCGFVTARKVPKSPPPRVIARGIVTGAPGCVSNNTNKKRCTWNGNVCINRSFLKKKK